MDATERLQKMKTIRDFEICSLEIMSNHAKSYFAAGACSKTTPRENEEAFHRYRIRPRVLRDVSNAEMSCKILDSSVSCPIGIDPVGFHVLAHEEAELATVKACCKEDCVFILSSSASRDIETVANEVSGLSEAHPVLWMQTYIHNDRSVTMDIIRKAEAFGFSAIVVTVDSPNGGLWRKVIPEDFFKVIKTKMPILPRLPRYLEDASVTFEDLKWIIQNSKLPVIVKGILSGEDAKKTVEIGVSAIIVSNHGGRLIERVVSTFLSENYPTDILLKEKMVISEVLINLSVPSRISIDVLEEIVDAVSHSTVEVYVDGGIRSGSDVFISLALGAKAAFIGRPSIWGLSVDGENGVKKVLQILKEELLLTMQLAGASTIEDIKRSMVVKI